ncbi:MAG: hypothetical protein IJ705_00590, partial [Oscillospiraceae bacterium]|nr:hypothetical protein [Oscillospiraceae bacterium]
TQWEVAPIMVSDRLNFLMDVTNTQNSALGRALSFDQSYISKIRSGKRKMPRKQPFIERASAYFARNLGSEYQKKAVSDEVLKGRPLPENREQLQRLLAEYLASEDGGSDSAAALLRGFSALTADGAEARTGEGSESVRAQRVPASAAALPFYGDAGKREAVELFLSRLCDTGETQTLLLYSDESMAWLVDDPAFARRWAALLGRIIARGGRIRLIHSMRRDVSELMEAVRKWMPLYLTGGIEAYYCPRLRDGLYRRSLFVARGTAALVSSSVGEQTGGMVNLLFTEKAVVDAFETEFWNYFALCRPLMRFYRVVADAMRVAAEFRRVSEGAGTLYAASAVPSPATLPRAVLASLGGGAEVEKRRAEAAAALRARLAAGGRVVEILNLPAPESVRRGEVPLYAPGLTASAAPRYSPGALAKHIAAARQLSSREEGYRRVLSRQVPPELLLMASEEGALLCSPLPVAFGMEEQTICAALLEYLARVAGEDGRRSTDRLLAEYLQSLEEKPE